MTLTSWGALVLAAGAGRRFGGGKLLAELCGVPVIRRTTQSVLAAGFGEVVVVTGAGHRQVADALGGLACRIVQGAGWEEGMAASIRTGSAALAPGNAGLFVFLGDMPFAPVELCAPLAVLAQASGYAARPVCNGRPGHPVCLVGDALVDLASLRGDEGAAHLLRRRAADVAYLETDADGATLDIDTPADLEAAERMWKSRTTSATSDSAISRGALPKP